MLEAEYEKEREKIEGKEDDRLKEERIQTLQTILQRAWRYQERGMLEEIILGFVQKKTAMLQNARTKGEPVSYTHLDVYKRQPLDGRTARRSMIPCGFQAASPISWNQL